MRILQRLQHQIQPYTLPDPAKRRRTIDFWIFLIGGASLATGIVIACQLLYSDARVAPRIGFNQNSWHISFETSSSNCDLNSKPNIGCLSHPENPLLWKSDVLRSSASFQDRYKSNSGSAFWMGTKVAPADLTLAAKKSAQVIVFPRMNGLVQVWLDGVYQTTHDFSAQRTPLMLTLPKSRLLDGKELVIALAIFPYLHQPVPEKANASAHEGFYTVDDADRLVKSEVFVATGPHLIAVALFLLMSAFLWSAAGASRTRDFAVGTQISLLIALVSLLSADLSFRVLNVDSYERLYFLFLIIEAVLVVRFTWTLARGARETSRGELLGIVGGLVVVYLLAPAAWIEVRGVNLMASLVLPITYIFCALLSAEQIVRLKAKSAIASRTRLELLGITCTSLVVTGVAYLLESSGQSGFHVIWSRWFNIIMLLGLVRAFARANATKSSLIEMSPASKYHKASANPTRVDGWLLNVEILKFSSNRQVMSTVLSHLWTVSRLREGEIIRADDRSLVVMIEKTADSSEDQRLVETLEEMSKCLKDLEHRLPIMFSGSQYPTSVLFRASAARASLTAEWQTSGSGIARLPTWIDVADARGMKAVKELLLTDLDGALRSNDSSVVVMSADDANHLMTRSLVSKRARVDLGEITTDVMAFFANRLGGKKVSAAS